MKKNVLIFLMGLLCSFPFMSKAQEVLMSWQFSRSNSTDITYRNTYGHFAMSGSELSRGDGFSVASLARGFSANIKEDTPIGNPTNFSIVTSLAKAKEFDAYYEFYIDVKPGYKSSLSSIEARLRRSGAGATSGAVSYSIDEKETFKDLKIFSLSGTAENGTLITIDLSDETELQSLGAHSRVYFRIYGWGFTSTTGSFAFGRVEGDLPGGAVNSPAWTSAQKIEATATLLPLKIYGAIIESNNEGRLVGWDFKNLNGKEAIFESTYTESNMNLSAINRGGGLVFPDGDYARGMYTSVSTVTSTKTLAEAAGNYFQFSLNTKSGYSFSVNTLDFLLRRSSNGSKNYVMKYSLDEGTTFNEIQGSEGVLLGQEAFYHALKIDLSSNADFKNIPSDKSIVFRLILWNEGAVSGTVILGRNEDNVAGFGLLVGGSTVLTSSLPVNLVDFSVSKNNSEIQLNWTTVSEDNNSHFEIYRAGTDGKFNFLATIPTKSNIGINSYDCKDLNPLSGINYYFLRQVDKDGVYKDYGIKSIDFDINKNKAFYASISKDGVVTVRIEGNNELEEGELKLINLEGKIQSSQKIAVKNGFNEFTLGNVNSSGIYVVTLKKSNKVTTYKLIR